MATYPMIEVLQYLRQTVLPGTSERRSDEQLLESYIRRRDEVALAALVHRHGPLVWGVCSRVLQDHHDAEDAFQATFLVLVRRAAAIASRELLAHWLYKVAYQTALKARATTAKRKEREKQMAHLPEPAAEEQGLWQDLKPLLDRELSCLPEKYRVVLVLCDLEGKTRREAAQLLRCPEGTVAGRLARARQLLAKRLGQRGITLSGGALAAALAEKVASARVPASVVFSTIKAASLFAAGEAATGAISVKAAVLAEGVLRAMFLTKLKSVSVVLLLVAALGTTGWIYQSKAAEKGPDPSSAQVPPQERKASKTDVQIARVEPGEPTQVPKEKAKTQLQQLEAEVRRLRAEIEALKKQAQQTPQAKAKDGEQVIKVYSLADLFKKGGEAECFVKILNNTLDEQNRDKGSIEYLWPSGFLIVRHSPEVQKQVQEILDELRKTKKEQQKAEAERGM